jgi:hypothetical protein
VTPRRSLTVLTAVWALGTIVAVYGAFQSRYSLSTVDGISYLSIARQYAEGHIDAALNAYWSPLVSWLMAPLIGLGIPDILAFDLVNAAAISVGAALIARLVWLRTGRRFVLALAALGTFLLFAIGNLPVLTPDMLVVTWILLFATVLLEVDDRMPGASTRTRLLLGVVLGAVGALGYVTKLYLVPVFAVTLIGWLIVRVGRMPRQRRNAALGRLGAVVAGGALALAVLAGPWIIALSVKYGEPMAGSSFGVNLEEKFVPDGSEGQGEQVLWAPPNEYAVSFGEDRTAQAGTSSATGPGSGPSPSLAERVVYYVSQRVTVLPYYLTRIGGIAPFAALTAVVVLLVLLFAPRFPARRDLAALGLLWGVYFLGYAAVTTAANRGGNSRYYWPLLVIALVMLALLVPEIWRRLVAGRQRWRAVLVVVLLALVPAAVAWQHDIGKGAPFSTEAPASNAGFLVRPAKPWEEQRFAAEELAPLIAPGSKLVGSNYRATLRSAYYLGAQVYGRADQGYVLADPAFQRLMRDAGIDFYLRYTPVAAEPADIGGAGDIVATFTERSTCNDDKLAVVEDCRIDVIALR